MELRSLFRLGPTGLAAVVAAVLLAWISGGGWTQGVSVFPPPPGEDTGEREMKALAAAYPDRITAAAQRDGDWGVRMDGAWFLWAHGRILPEAQSAGWEKYSRYRFYPYPLEWLPPLPHLDDAAIARLKTILRELPTRPPRSDVFLDELFSVGSRAATESRIVTVDFLGFPVRVLSRIVEPLHAAAREIAQKEKVDPEIASFMRGIYEIDGFNYRDVAGTRSRSYHSYGLALDFIPRTYHGRRAYWRWVAEQNGEWWALPYEQRWMLPAGVVSAFERQGFVWGGKWLFFDTMHFEYRPEIFILAREKGAP